MIIYSQRAGEGAEIVWLEHWSIRESADGARRFVGCNCATRRGCVSEKIFFLDSATRTAHTLSGRIYQLVGPSGYNVDAEYVFNTIAKNVGNSGPWRDVTAELIPDCQECKAVTANCEEMTLEAAARVLCLSRTYVKGLINDDKISGRVGDSGVQWIPITALTEYRAKMHAEQQTAFEKLVSASENLGLFDAEVSDVPARGTSSDDETK
ncbi:hypothetical protein PQR11_20585 [Paraburkholderia strydomiana]|uniref:hypothetical protein n=1 Tax=Paraburkholderia strydomiana TaxID=1245417 RepID=UPI0038BA4808